MRPVLPLLLSLSLCAPTLADWSGPIEQPLWSLPAAPGLSRWLIVHHLSRAAADGLYHVEVLERRQGQQPWQFQRLAAHLALTEQALRASIVAPLKRGGVYPESYQFAYRQWQERQAAGQAPVCRRTVDECLRAPD
ncbi:DUF5086 family protein [Pseudomonas aeruginosa]|nr:DUF5086 family protein [Pseudomonas aeruginosa]